MQTITEKTVREIAIENPASVRVFESFGIDYCCGGKMLLSDACSRAHIDTDRVCDLLATAGRDSQAAEPSDFSENALCDLISRIIEKHHSFVRRETPRIQSLLAKVTEKHGPAHPEIERIGSLFTAIGQELSPHMLKEEQVLFPYIVRLEQAVLAGNPIPPAFFGSVQNPIANMMAEHEDAGALLSQIRQLANRYTAPVDACPTFLALYNGLEDFERDLHQHIHLENNILFPRAIAIEQAH